MKKLDNDIDISIDMMKRDTFYTEKNYKPIILFSNENGKAKQEIFNFKDKKVLCPTASGDQFINAKFYNAQRVETYDINTLSEYITNLKIAAVKALTHEEFILFFLPELHGEENKYFLSRQLFNKVKPHLNEKDSIYWDFISSYGRSNGFGKYIDFGYYGYDLDEIKTDAPYYAEPFYYNILKGKLLKNSNHKFINKDIRDFNSKEKYDMIDLSNIISSLIIKDYYNDNGDFTLEELNEMYTHFINQDIYSLLNNNGDILVNYDLYLEQSKLDSLVYHDKYESYNIPSKKKNHTDKVLRYRRR